MFLMEYDFLLLYFMIISYDYLYTMTVCCVILSVTNFIEILPTKCASDLTAHVKVLDLNVV